MQGEYDWNDLRYFLAAVRGGSLTRAAASLGASLSTVSRRIAALEESLGSPLFLRTPDGLSLTAAGEATLAHAEQVEAGAVSVTDRLAELAGVPQGTVRVTMAGADLLSLVLLPRLGALTERYPLLQIEFETRPELSDLVRREADIAVRTARPTQGVDELICRRARDEGFSAFASTRYLDQAGRGRPAHEYEWISPDLDREDLPGGKALLKLAGGTPRVRLSSQTATREAVRLGLGCSIVSDTFGALTPGLERIPGLPAPLTTLPLYLICHRGLRHVPRVAAVWDWLLGELANQEDELNLLRGRLA